MVPVRGSDEQSKIVCISTVSRCAQYIMTSLNKSPSSEDSILSHNSVPATSQSTTSECVVLDKVETQFRSSV